MCSVVEQPSNVFIAKKETSVTVKNLATSYNECKQRNKLDTSFTIKQEINGLSLNFTFEGEDDSQICPDRERFYLSTKNAVSLDDCMKKCAEFTLCIRFSFFQYYLECKLKASRRCWRNEPCAFNYIKRPNFCFDLIKEGVKEITSEVYFDNEGGYCYTHLHRMNFQSAKMACRSIGMHVLKLWIQQDVDTGNSFFVRLRKLKFRNVWLGLHRASSADTFIWQSDLWKDFDAIPSTHSKIVETGLGEGACFTASLDSDSTIDWVNRDCFKNVAHVICFRPIMGEWGPWVAWRPCSTCKERRMERHRDCNMPEPIIGSCLGEKFDYKSINVESEPLPPYYYHIYVGCICGTLVLLFAYVLKKIQSSFYGRFVEQLHNYEREAERDYFTLKNRLADYVSDVCETSPIRTSKSVKRQKSYTYTYITETDSDPLKEFNQAEEDGNSDKIMIEKLEEAEEEEDDEKLDYKNITVAVDIENHDER
ncbi:unnamed protein product [Dimorphilus gyrociliatus]|uniref:C-type lectin domain-containing protein n=1 Tax=Dimorphilus gyrociliatus TaxID=2664684 RepID=A0A7I8VQT8_9ANNE|nr:unnamed protein product [Dimorphilus gyrociliatus]